MFKKIGLFSIAVMAIAVYAQDSGPSMTPPTTAPPDMSAAPSSSPPVPPPVESATATPGAMLTPGASTEPAADASATPSAEAEPPAPEEEEGTAEIEIPPPETPPKPVLELPESFPAWQQIVDRKVEDKISHTDYSGLDAKVRRFSEQLYLSGYASEKPIEPSGKYLETEAMSSLPTEMTYVYVSMKPGAGEIGQHFLIVRDRGPLKKVNKDLDSFKANLIQICGELELTERVAEKRKSGKGDTFRALITKALDLTEVNFSLVPGRVERVSLSPDGPRAGILAQVIGAQKHEASNLYSPGEIVFINKGSGDGVENGQILSIYLNRSTRKIDTIVTNAPIPSGLVKVVRTGDKVSTAVIVAATEGIQQGDFLQNESRAEAIDHSSDPDAYDPASDEEEEEELEIE